MPNRDYAYVQRWIEQFPLDVVENLKPSLRNFSPSRRVTLVTFGTGRNWDTNGFDCLIKLLDEQHVFKGKEDIRSRILYCTLRLENIFNHCSLDDVSLHGGWRPPRFLPNGRSIFSHELRTRLFRARKSNESYVRLDNQIDASRTCASCGRQRRRMPKCSGCKTVHYCDAQCQGSHWSVHRAQCRPDLSLPVGTKGIHITMSYCGGCGVSSTASVSS